MPGQALLPAGTAAWPSGPSGTLHTSEAWCAGVWLGASTRCPARPYGRPSISHVIPLRLFQTLNVRRWNCNVFGVSRKMTVGNYVRNLGGGGVVAARGHRSRALSARWAGCLKPPSPLRVLAEPRLKPPSPLRALAEPRLKPPSPLRAPAEPRLKPPSPLRAPAEPQLKPPSPLRVRNECFWCIFRVQRRCRFQGSPVGGEQW